MAASAAAVPEGALEAASIAHAAALSLMLCMRAPAEADVRRRAAILADAFLTKLNVDALEQACVEAAAAGEPASAWSSELLGACLDRIPATARDDLAAGARLLYAICMLLHVNPQLDTALAGRLTKSPAVKKALTQLAQPQSERDLHDDVRGTCAWLALRVLAASSATADAGKGSIFLAHPPPTFNNASLLWSTWMKAYIAEEGDAHALVDAANACLARGDAHAIEGAAAALNARAERLGIDAEDDAAEADVDGGALSPLACDANFAYARSRVQPLLQSRARDARIAALRVLAGCTGEQKASAPPSETALVDACDGSGDGVVVAPARALVALHSAARLPENLMKHRRATTLISRHVTVFARGGGLRSRPDVRACVAGALLGHLHTQFTPLWPSLTEALGAVLESEVRDAAAGFATLPSCLSARSWLSTEPFSSMLRRWASA